MPNYFPFGYLLIMLHILSNHGYVEISISLKTWKKMLEAPLKISVDKKRLNPHLLASRGLLSIFFWRLKHSR